MNQFYDFQRKISNQINAFNYLEVEKYIIPDVQNVNAKQNFDDLFTLMNYARANL